MLINSGKILNTANRLAGKNLSLGLMKYKDCTPLAVCHLHKSAGLQNKLAVETVLPLPNNVDAAETTRFSPLRSRDISASVVLSQAPISTIDITADNTMTALNANSSYGGHDPHVQSYDCFGAVSLNSVMQSNVPSPFGGMHKFSHLNMPGGQWSQEYKFMSQNLQSSHYHELREKVRAEWVVYNQNATLTNKGNNNSATIIKRHFSTQQNPTSPPTEPPVKSTTASESGDITKLSKKDQLKRAFKDYGATIIAFHVGISLISLGGFYLLISSGVNMAPIMEFLGISDSAFSEKIATGSTFVVAYAVHKVFAPLRISITLGSTPFIVRYLRTKGFLKPKIKATS